MKEVTLITGPLRSGTSCVTGLLERFGFDLGKNVRVLREPTEYNPRGHYEHDLLYAINERLLIETKKSYYRSIIEPPEESALRDLSEKREKYFRLFLRKFDGEVCKDPLMCLTLPFWKPYWPQLRRVVFCLRHPLAVAKSIEKRYLAPVHLGLEVWRTYVTRFFNFADHNTCNVYVFDFDAFRRSPSLFFYSFLKWLDWQVPEQDIQTQIDGFFGPENVHWAFGKREFRNLPDDISELYQDICSRAGGNT